MEMISPTPLLCMMPIRHVGSIYFGFAGSSE